MNGPACGLTGSARPSRSMHVNSSNTSTSTRGPVRAFADAVVALGVGVVVMAPMVRLRVDVDRMKEEMTGMNRTIGRMAAKLHIEDK